MKIQEITRQLNTILRLNRLSYLKQCADSFDKASHIYGRTSFMAAELAKLLNNNNQDHANDLKTFINVATWKEVILKGER